MFRDLRLEFKMAPKFIQLASMIRRGVSRYAAPKSDLTLSSPELRKPNVAMSPAVCHNPLCSRSCEYNCGISCHMEASLHLLGPPTSCCYCAPGRRLGEKDISYPARTVSQLLHRMCSLDPSCLSPVSFVTLWRLFPQKPLSQICSSGNMR